MAGRFDRRAGEAARKRLPDRLGGRTAEAGRKHPSGRSRRRPAEAGRGRLLRGTSRWLTLLSDRGLGGQRNRVCDLVRCSTGLGEVLLYDLGAGGIGTQYPFLAGRGLLKQRGRLGV